MEAVRALIEGKKSYIVAGVAGLLWLGGEFGLLSPDLVDTGLKGAGVLFGATVAAKINRIRGALAS